MRPCFESRSIAPDQRPGGCAHQAIHGCPVFFGGECEIIVCGGAFWRLFIERELDERGCPRPV